MTAFIGRFSKKLIIINPRSVQHVGVSPSAIVGSNPLAAREADEVAAPISSVQP